MKKLLSLLHLVCVFGVVACNAAGDLGASNVEVRGSEQALLASPVDTTVVTQLSPGVLVGAGGTGGGVTTDLKACTPADRDTCQQCQNDCQAGICSTNQGGQQAGGCIGLFCPTRCDVCILSCSQVRSCVRCYGR